MTLLHSDREGKKERERERGTEIPMKLEHRSQSIHSRYIFNLYTMALSPNQTRPTRPARNLVTGWCQPKKLINVVAIMKAGVLGA